MYYLLAIVATIFVVMAVFVFNALIRNRNRVRNAWSDIDVQLKKRYDLVPNLVEVVNVYKTHEADVFENVAKARTAAVNASANDIADKSKVEDSFSSSIKSLLAVAENYPQLRASENFQNLQNQLALIENNIESARRYYNATVREFNNAIQVFPASIIAMIFGFKQSDFFGADEKEKNATTISFQK